jgi:glycosyltransferase involved in cell wall biosynthesis
MTPIVSVCVPSYNSEHHLAATIESVLAQSLEDFELIIVDDCSSDRSAEVARRFDDPRIRVLVNESNIGAAANWDRACGMASGEFVKLLCGDDLMYPTCLETQVAAFGIPRTKPALVAARRDVIDSGGRVVLSGRGLSGMSKVVPGDVATRRAVRSGTNPFGEPVCVLMRNELLRKAGRFRGPTQYMMDFDMWCRLLVYGDLYAVDESLAAFRLQDQSWSHRLARHQSLQAHALFFELRRDRPDLISGWDVIQASIKACSLSVARRMSYRVLELSRRRSSDGLPPAAVDSIALGGGTPP